MAGLDRRQDQGDRAGRGPGDRDRSAGRAVGLGDVRPRQGIPSEGGRSAPRPDRLARRDAGPGAAGPRRQVARGAGQGDPDPPRSATPAISLPCWSPCSATPSSTPTRSCSITGSSRSPGTRSPSPGVLYVRGPRYDVLRTYTVDESRVAFTRRAPLVAPMPDFADRRECSSASSSSATWRTSSHRSAASPPTRSPRRPGARPPGGSSERHGSSGPWAQPPGETWARIGRRGGNGGPKSGDMPTIRLRSGRPGPHVRRLTSRPITTTSTSRASPPARPCGRSTGPRPIESIEIGDQVLTQDPRTGALELPPGHRRPPQQARPALQDRPRPRGDQGHGHPPVLEGRAGLGHGPRPQARRRPPNTGRGRDGEVGRAGRRRAGLQPQGAASRELSSPARAASWCTTTARSSPWPSPSTPRPHPCEKGGPPTAWTDSRCPRGFVGAKRNA